MTQPPNRPPTWFPLPQPNRPPKPYFQYSKAVLWSLTAAFALGWLFILIGNGQSASSSAVNPVFNLGISLFLGTLITALILDFRGFFTLRGSIKWRQVGILLGLMYLAFFFFSFGVYLFRLFREAQRPAAQPEIAPATASFGGRLDPRHSAIFGMLCVALITVCWFAAASAGSSTAASPQATQVANSANHDPTHTPHAATNTPSSHATATGTPSPTATTKPTPTNTPKPQPTNTPKPQPTNTPRPQPTNTPAPSCSTGGAPANPWCYTFTNTGKTISNPPGNFCNYFNCIPSFWQSTNGYIEECADFTYSHSGGVSGSCSHHGGNLRPLYQP
jgi:hypothetical protein